MLLAIIFILGLNFMAEQCMHIAIDFIFIVSNILNLILILFFPQVYLRESMCANRGGTERKGERILSTLHTVSAEPDGGLHLTNREIVT